jgi:hypothetical protein
VTSKYGLYDPEHMDDEGLAEKADALVDEFIATLTIEDLTGIHNAVCEEAWALVERCVTFSVARGLDINTLGFSDTASREPFLDAVFERFTEEPMTAAEVAETLINGNISTAREAMTFHRTTTEAIVFALDVIAEMTNDGETGVLDALVRVRRCVNRG